MLQVTLLRSLVIIIAGILLFKYLMYATGIFERRHLKRRKKTKNKVWEETRPGYVFIWVTTFILVILFVFLFIDYQIKGYI